MRIPSSFRERTAVDIKMTPMIDVVFLLLIFFVCTASFQIVENVLPSQLAPLTGGSSKTIEDIDPQLVDLEPIIIQIKWYAEQQKVAWFLNNEPYANIEQVSRELAKIRRSFIALNTDITQKAVILDAEGEVPVGYVIDAYDHGRIEGFYKIQMAAEAN